MIETLKVVEITTKNPEIVEVDQKTLENLDLPLHEDVSESPIKEYRTLEDSLNEVSEEEREIYENANLEKKEINDRECLTRTDIDYEAKDDRGRTNLERMQTGKPPLIDGKPVELHHIGQKFDAPLAELTVEEHRGKGNDGILHEKSTDSEIDRNEFKKEREQHWKARAEEIIAERGNV